MERYYLDTCIWVDCYEKRGIRGEHALRFIERIIANGAIILFSDANLQEFKSIGYTSFEIREIFSIINRAQLQRVHITRHQLLEAAKAAVRHHVSKRDALHAILARDNHAILLSTDADFERLRSLVHSFRPEELP